MAQLQEAERFSRLAEGKKHIMDTIKMIAYRAETSMAGIIKLYMAKEDDARSLLQQIFKTEADIFPDEQTQTLTISLHNMANDCSDKIIQKLCEVLNDSETKFPATNLRLVFKMVSNNFLADQEF